MTKADVIKRTLPIRKNTHNKISSGFSKTGRFINARPLTSFFVALAILICLIVIGNFINKPKLTETTQALEVKTVQAYRIGTAPTIKVSAQVKKSGVIQIVALSSGIINEMNVQEGSQVKQGQQLLGMSDDYKGSNILSLQRQSASTQYQGALAIYPKKKESIEQEKEQAEKNKDDAEQTRKITKQSVDETQTLVNDDTDILKTLQANLVQAQTGTDSAAILGLKQLVAQYQASTNQANQALRTVQYNADSDNPPAEKASLTKEIAKKQLDIQLKQLQIDLEVSRLAYAMASLKESLMFPTAPFSGTIQRVFVKEKEQVTQGQQLFVISQVAEEDPITAVAYVSADVAKRISRIAPSTIHIGNKISYETTPTFISTEAVQGSLYAIYYPIADEYNSELTNDGMITVTIPLGMADTTTIATYIPLDAIYQTRENAYIFVARNGKAESKTVQLGQVYGRYVEVISGLSQGDVVILNRNIINGDMVQIQ